MIPRELFAQVRRIEILTSRLVNETFAGEYLSAFKGQGMEFAEVREYVPGDDVRTIDWNVTARAGRPFIRKYAEERELTVAIACDLSASQYFGTAGRLKKELAAELAAVLAFSALQNNDKVGLFLFTEGVENHVPPRKGRRHALHIIRDVLAYEPSRRGTDLSASIDRINRALKRRCIVFLISDFRDEGFEKPLRLMAVKHDVVPVLIGDPRERNLPAGGPLLEIEDPESGRRLTVDAGAIAEQARAEARRADALETLFRQTGLESIDVSTDRPYIDALAGFFRRRARRMRGR